MLEEYKSLLPNLFDLVEKVSKDYLFVKENLITNSDAVIFSTNVLSAYSDEKLFDIDEKYPFCQFNNPQMHLVRYDDFSRNLGTSQDYSQLLLKRKLIPNDLLDKFSTHLNITYDINIKHIEGSYVMLFWNIHN